MENFGVCGDNIRWELQEDGKLLLNGSGEMYHYGYNPFHKNTRFSPWIRSTEIKRVIIEDGIESIGSGAFIGCKNLEEVYIPDSVYSIGISAFSGCASLKSIVIPRGVSVIEQETFMGCKQLASVTLPDGITKIYNSAFCGCAMESVDLFEV